MKVAGIAFEERVTSLDAADFKTRVREVSATGKVPALADGQTHVWESLAILEYLAEKFPQAGLWPGEPQARAHARSIAAEMHAGFAALRSHFPMNVRRPVRPRAPTPEAANDIGRIEAMWTDCRTRFGEGGPFLFGAFGAADAMYAPIVSRFHTYAITVGAPARAYMDAVLSLPAWGEWQAAAAKEPWVLPHDEVD
jgi:glutathione S-transferase